MLEKILFLLYIYTSTINHNKIKRINNHNKRINKNHNKNHNKIKRINKNKYTSTILKKSLKNFILDIIKPCNLANHQQIYSALKIYKIRQNSEI